MVHLAMSVGYSAVIININAIQNTGSYFNSRLKVISLQLKDDNAIVSRERVGDFKEWLGK
jgi:hypothetical protein